MLLEQFSRFAHRLRGLGLPLALLGGLLVGVAVVLTLTTTSERADRWLLLALVGALWAGCGWLFIHAFQHVPPRPDDLPHGWPRFRVQLNRAFHWLLALAFTGITLMAFSLTGKLIEEWRGMA